MAANPFTKLGKALVGSSKQTRPKSTVNNTAIKIENSFKKREDLTNLSDAEKLACDIFSKFYGNVQGAIRVKEESLPLTTYANCIRTLRMQLERDASSAQLVSVLWGKMSIANTPKTYKSECTKFDYYRYSPNYEHEKVLIFAGLMVVVSVSFPNKERIPDIVKAIRTSAHSQDNIVYFGYFDQAIHTFDPNEVFLGLNEVINAIKTATKPYKALALYELLLNNFSNDNSIVTYIKNECHSVNMAEPEAGTRIEHVTVGDGGSMNMFDQSTIHAEVKSLPTNDRQKLIEDEH